MRNGSSRDTRTVNVKDEVGNGMNEQGTDEQQPAENVSRETDDQQPADDEQPAENVSRETDEQPADSEESDDEPAGDERSEIGKVRREAAAYRTKLRDAEKRVDELSRRLVAARVKESGRLADPDDMPYDESLLDDDNLTAAIDDLIERKPHLKARSFGNVGQHDQKRGESVSLGSLLRASV